MSRLLITGWCCIVCFVFHCCGSSVVAMHVPVRDKRKGFMIVKDKNTQVVGFIDVTWCTQKCTGAHVKTHEHACAHTHTHTHNWKHPVCFNEVDSSERSIYIADTDYSRWITALDFVHLVLPKHFCCNCDAVLVLE